METNQTRRKNDRNKINGWKWAFIALVVVIFGFFVYLGTLLQPISTNQPVQEQVISTNNQVSLTTSLTKADAEIIINDYLDASMGEDFSAYDIVLSNNLEIHGQLEIFSFDVPFTLYFSPYALENGNIQLRGEAVELANFSLPVSGVMSLLARQLELPGFIAVDSNRQIIEIYLIELMEDYSFDLAVTQINLEEDIIEFNLGMDREMLTNQLD